MSDKQNINWEEVSREENRKFQEAFYALQFIYNGVRQGDITGKPILTGYNAPEAKEWGMLSLRGFIEDAFERIGGIVVKPDKPKRKSKKGTTK